MRENPFFNRKRIEDPAYFYGRDAEVRRICAMLRNQQCVSVSGARKIGKTSLLYHISQPDVMRRHGLDPSVYVFCYLDCEGLATFSLEQLYSCIVEEVEYRAARQGHTLADVSHSDPYLAFRRLLREASNGSRNLRVVLVLDELEALSQNSELCETLYPQLRALATEALLTCLVASQPPLADYTRDEFSPFFNIFAPVDLGLFGEPECHTLLSGYLAKADADLRPEAIAQILKLSGRHPFFLQVIGYHALAHQEAAGVPLQGGDVDVLARIALPELEPHFEYYWHRLDSRERYSLAALAFTQKNVAYREPLRSLAKLCFIVEEDGRYDYFSPLLLDYVRHQEVEGILQVGPLVLVQALQSALLNEKPLRLSGRELALLCYLALQSGRVASNEELDRNVLTPPGELDDYMFVSEDRVKSAIRDLRRTLGEHRNWIVNVPGRGYALRIGREE